MNHQRESEAEDSLRLSDPYRSRDSAAGKGSPGGRSPVGRPPGSYLHLHQSDVDTDGPPTSGPSDPFPGDSCGGLGGVGKGSTRSPGTCGAYLQLFGGWLVLNMLTLFMAVVPHSAQFLDIEPDFHWGSGHPESDRYVVYGLWVLVEIALFFVLIVMATVVMCSCKNIPPGPGFIHILVDPAFVTLGSVPFLLMRGLPRVGALQACFTVHGPLLDPDSPVITRLPIMYHHTDNNVTHVALDARISPGVQCLMALPYKLPENFTLFDADGNIRPGAQSVIQESLGTWLTLLQGAVLSPVVLRILHFRWKMSWQPFVHSNCYFFLQALDGATLVQLSTRIHAAPWSLLSQTLTYMAALALCLGSLTLAVPPVYTGNHVTNKYLKWSTYAGTVLIDAPFLMLRLYFLHTTEHSYSAIFSVDGVFCAMVVKEMVFVCACVWVGLRKVSQCVGSTYLSLSLNDPDFEEYEMSVYV